MNPRHSRFHPRWYRERLPIFWWLERWSYTLFIVRELTSLFVAYGAVLLLVQVRALAAGEEATARFDAWLRTPGAMAFHGLVLLALLFHTATWIHLAPRAMEVRVGARRVPDGVVLAGHCLAWVVATGLVAWLLAGR